MALDLLAADEEDRGSAHAVELREDSGRALRMRTVVERQQHSARRRRSSESRTRRAAPGRHGDDRGRPVSGEYPAGRDRERPQRLHVECPRPRSRCTEETPSPSARCRRTAAEQMTGVVTGLVIQRGQDHLTRVHRGGSEVAGTSGLYSGLDRHAAEVPREQVVRDGEPLSRREVGERAAEPVRARWLSSCPCASNQETHAARGELGHRVEARTVRSVGTSWLDQRLGRSHRGVQVRSCARRAARAEIAPLVPNDERDVRSRGRSTCSRAARAPRRRRIGRSLARSATTRAAAADHGQTVARASLGADRHARHHCEDEARCVDACREIDDPSRPPWEHEERTRARLSSVRARRARARPSPARAAVSARAARRTRRLGNPVRGPPGGHSARRVDEDVRGGEQVAHSIGEAEHPDARLFGEGTRDRARVASDRVPQGRAPCASRLSAVATAPDRSPTAQPPPETTTTSPPPAGRAHVRRRRWTAAPWNSPVTSRDTWRALPRPARRSTSGTRLSCITRWRSTPLSAQSSRPAKSVIVAHTGMRTLPRRRRQPRIVVAAGQVDTTTSGGCSGGAEAAS